MSDKNNNDRFRSQFTDFQSGILTLLNLSAPVYNDEQKSSTSPEFILAFLFGKLLIVQLIVVG